MVYLEINLHYFFVETKTKLLEEAWIKIGTKFKSCFHSLLESPTNAEYPVSGSGSFHED